MDAPLFAMPPPGSAPMIVCGIVLVMLGVGFFVKLTARKDHGPDNEQNRRAGLGMATVLCGPLVGALLAGLAHATGGIHPVDVTHTYVVSIGIGSVAGLIAGIA